MLAAKIFFVFSVVVSIFQLALALGVPWGEYAMGGKFPGKLPIKMRILAVLQIVVIMFFTAIVLTKAGMILSNYYNLSRIAIWFVIAYFVLGSILNLITNSKGERLIWGPITVLMLISSIIVAIS